MSQGMVAAVTGLGSAAGLSCEEIRRLMDVPGMTINPATAPALYTASVACGIFSPASGTPQYRENPGLCNWPGVELITSILGSTMCVPQSNEDQVAAQKAELQKVCRNSTNPGACVSGTLVKSQADVDAATRSEAIRFDKTPEDIECEQKAAVEHPTLSSIFGTSLVCVVTSGSATPWLIGGAALLVVMLMKRR